MKIHMWHQVILRRPMIKQCTFFSLLGETFKQRSCTYRWKISFLFCLKSKYKAMFILYKAVFSNIFQKIISKFGRSPPKQDRLGFIAPLFKQISKIIARLITSTNGTAAQDVILKIRLICVKRLEKYRQPTVRIMRMRIGAKHKCVGKINWKGVYKNCLYY